MNITICSFNCRRQLTSSYLHTLLQQFHLLCLQETGPIYNSTSVGTNDTSISSIFPYRQLNAIPRSSGLVCNIHGHSLLLGSIHLPVQLTANASLRRSILQSWIYVIQRHKGITILAFDRNTTPSDPEYLAFLQITGLHDYSPADPTHMAGSHLDGFASNITLNKIKPRRQPISEHHLIEASFTLPPLQLCSTPSPGTHASAKRPWKIKSPLKPIRQKLPPILFPTFPKSADTGHADRHVEHVQNWLYNTLKGIVRTRPSPRVKVITLQDSSNNTLTHPASIKDDIQRHFTSIFQNSSVPSSTDDRESPVYSLTSAPSWPQDMVQSPNISDTELQHCFKKRTLSTGPDGISAAHWYSAIASDPSGLRWFSSYLEYYWNRPLPSVALHTRLLLIPKKTGLKQAKDYRPISICNHIGTWRSRVFAKLLASQHQLLHPNQQTALSGRGAQTLLRWLKDKLYTFRNKFLLVKIFDQSKAFDTISLSYLQQHLRRLEAPMSLIQHVQDMGRQTIRIHFPDSENGPPPVIHRSRGLPQGDPLSPLLLAILQDPLIHRLNAQSGESVAYADDLLSISFALTPNNFTHCEQAWDQCLQEYSSVTGQCFNLSKTIRRIFHPHATDQKCIRYLGIDFHPQPKPAPQRVVLKPYIFRLQHTDPDSDLWRETILTKLLSRLSYHVPWYPRDIRFDRALVGCTLQCFPSTCTIPVTQSQQWVVWNYIRPPSVHGVAHQTLEMLLGYWSQTGPATKWKRRLQSKDDPALAELNRALLPYKLCLTHQRRLTPRLSHQLTESSHYYVTASATESLCTYEIYTSDTHHIFEGPITIAPFPRTSYPDVCYLAAFLHITGQQPRNKKPEPMRIMAASPTIHQYHQLLLSSTRSQLRHKWHSLFNPLIARQQEFVLEYTVVPFLSTQSSPRPAPYKLTCPKLQKHIKTIAELGCTLTHLYQDDQQPVATPSNPVTKHPIHTVINHSYRYIHERWQSMPMYGQMLRRFPAAFRKSTKPRNKTLNIDKYLRFSLWALIWPGTNRRGICAFCHAPYSHLHPVFGCAASRPLRVEFHNELQQILPHYAHAFTISHISYRSPGPAPESLLTNTALLLGVCPFPLPETVDIKPHLPRFQKLAATYRLRFFSFSQRALHKHYSRNTATYTELKVAASHTPSDSTSLRKQRWCSECKGMNDTRGIGHNKRSHPSHKSSDRRRQKPRHELGPRYEQRQRQVAYDESMADGVLAVEQESSQHLRS
mgnify:CR=1 FL=1